MTVEKDRKPRRASVSNRIEDDLRARVTGRQWAPGVMLPGRRDLAKEYGVHLRTIQRAVEPLLADGTLRADDRRGTFVRAGEDGRVEGDGVTTARTKTIAAILDLSLNPTDPSANAVPRAVYRVARRHSDDIRVLIFDTHDATEPLAAHQEEHALNVVATEGIVGAVLRPVGAEKTAAMQRVLGAGIPFVCIDSFPLGLECDFVGVDNEGGAREACEHLLTLGHRRIACLRPSHEISTVRERVRGYRNALEAAGIAPAPELLWKIGPVSYGDMEALRREIGQALDHFEALAEPPTAVFVIEDFLAQILVDAVRARGGSVPGTLSVVGFDDLEHYAAPQPFLTTVRQPFEAMGERATDLLLDRLETPPGERRTFRHLLLPTKLIVRASTAPPHYKDLQ